MKKKKVSYAKYGYIFSIPFITAFLLFTLYPLLYTVVIGFTDLKGLGRTDFNFCPDLFQNFKTILANASFKTAFANTFIIWGFNFLPQILLALLLAALFTNNRRKIKGQGFFKVVFYMPNIITAATVAILFASLFGYPMGPMNDLIKMFGAEDSYYFLNNKYWAKGVVAFIQFWQWYGYTMIILISGILGINPELFEAAEIDGASGWKKFWAITFPLISPTTFYMFIMGVIGGLQSGFVTAKISDIPNI